MIVSDAARAAGAEVRLRGAVDVDDVVTTLT